MNRSAALLLACIFLAAPAYAQEATTDETPSAENAIGTDIVVVRVAGPWQAEDRRGFSRLIGRAADGNISFALEWISDEGAVVESLDLPSPPGAEHVPLARTRSDPGEEDSAVYFDTPEGTLVLIVGVPGDARFGPATN